MNNEELILAALAGHEGFLKGPGVRKVVTGTNPAANAEVAAADFVVPAGKIWVPISFSVLLAQGITQTPAPALVWDDGTNVLGAAPGSTAAVSVSTTTRMTWSRGLRSLPTAGAALTANMAVLPDLVLPAGYRLATLTAGIGANTDYGVPNLLVVEFSV